MAVRIYALAKELSYDSKELVEVCARAGVTGKGSALASLSDDEVTKVKEYLKGGTKSGGKPSRPGKAAKAAPPAMERPSGTSRGDKLKTLTAPKAGLSANAKLNREPLGQEPVQEEEIAAASMADEQGTDEQGAVAAEATEAGAISGTEAAPTVEAAAADTAGSDSVGSDSPAADQSPAAPSDAAKSDAEQPAAPKPEEPKLSKPGPLARMMGREEYVRPGAQTGKMPVVGKKGDAGRRKPGENPARARPVVKLAAMPTPAEKKKTLVKKKDEAPAQKPDMKLPADVLGRGGQGAKPLAAQLQRAERTLEAAKLKDKSQAESEAAGRGKGGKGGKNEEGGSGRPMLGGREQRQLNRNRGSRGSNRPRRIFRRTRKSGLNTAAPRKDRISVQLPCTVKELSEAAGVPAMQILKLLLEEGVMTTITAQIDLELTEYIAEMLGAELDFIQPETLEDKVLTKLDEQVDSADDLVTRAPIVTFLGHVDHGKTSLLDRLIGIKVAAGESGGITQHIRAYQIENEGKPISFVDTPGHEAFTEMRARGAGVTDIIVLVVAADDGVMPQTEEAISHAKAAGVPIVVAMNKIDLPGIDPMKTLTGLSQNELQPSEWGGDIEVVKTSAETGEGLDDLLETILTIAELNEYKANPKRDAIGTCLESRQDADRGVVATVIVQNGTLKVGDIVVCGDAHGKVKAMVDPLHPRNRIKEAGPSVPVHITGFDIAPPAGKRIYVLDDVAQAREIAESRADSDREDYLGTTGFQQTTLDNLFDRLDGAEEVQTLNLILRADTRGSIEAIEKELTKLEHPEIRLRILQRSVGGVTEGDILLAEASQAVVIAFNVVPDDNARMKAENSGVEIRRYSIIYKIADDLKAAMEGMLKPEEREVQLGRVLVQMTFKISRVGVIAGCRVLQGTVERNARTRVIRDNTIVGDYRIDTLRRDKDDAKEVREGYECGIKLKGFNDIKEADLLEVYKVEQIARSFDD